MDSQGPKISEEVFLGNPTIDRREALQRLGLLGLTTLVGQSILGADSCSVGFKHAEFAHHPFRAIGGIVDKDKIILPSGTSLILGQYGNPIAAPAAFHGAPLKALNPALVDLQSFQTEILRGKDGSAPPEALQEFRIYMALIRDKDHYRVFDLSQQYDSPPEISVASDGGLEVKQSGGRIITALDGYYLRMLYHPDVNRIDPKAVVGIFEQGSPPTPNDRILAGELDSPIIPTSAATSGWKEVATSRFGTFDIVQAHAELISGESFIRSGPNVWRYEYLTRDGKGVFEGSCKKHGGLPNEAWDQMGGQLFYKLISERGGTVINPEPSLGSARSVRDLNPTGEELYATGVVLYSLREGALHKNRTSLSKLETESKQTGGVKIEGDTLRYNDGSAERVYRITELRGKPGFASNTADLYAWETSWELPANLRPSRPVVGQLGGYDIVAAMRATRQFLDRS